MEANQKSSLNKSNHFFYGTCIHGYNQVWLCLQSMEKYCLYFKISQESNKTYVFTICCEVWMSLLSYNLILILNV